MPDDDANAIHARIVVLETRIAYQDDALETLNAAVTAQWSVIEALTRQVSEMRDRLSETETRQPSANADELPPHY